MLGELVPCGGGDPIPLLKPKLLVGRKSLCDLALSFANVSSRHCELEHRDGYWFVRDLGSTNGTRVDGEPCESKCLLPGAELSIANHRFTVSYKSDTVEPDADSETNSLVPRASLMEIAGFADSEFDEPRSVPAAGSDDRAFGEIVPCGGGEPISLVKPRLEVGRHGNCDVRLRYPNVSARHCELEFRDGYWFVHDFGSRNGIQVDGTRCQSKCLKPGSILSIASHRYKVVYTPRSEAPPPEEKEALFARTLLEKAGLIRKK